MVLGPYFLPPRLNSQYYVEFLDHNLIEFVENIPIGDRNDTYFQQDGCPARSARVVTDWLNEKFPGKWLGLHGPIKWPARSLDLTPLDFFLWGEIKRLVYDGRTLSRKSAGTRRTDYSGL